MWVNTKALGKAGITRNTLDPANGKINHYPNGEPSGFLQEMAIDLITPALAVPTVEDYKKAILYYQQIGLSNGIVSAFEPMLSHTGDEPIRMNAYEELEKEGVIESVPGRGFYVCEQKNDHLREKQMMNIENRMSDLLAECENAGMTIDDVIDMVRVLGENNG